MAVHEQVLAAAQRLCSERARPVFAPNEIVKALPHLNAQTVRTHVTSRCCINARPHHQSRLPYFRKTDRGQYELLPEYRTSRSTRTSVSRRPRSLPHPQRDAIHAVITSDGNTYVVECHEVAVVTQGRTIDEALANLTEALILHLAGEDLTTVGLADLKRVHVSYDLPVNVTAA